jgi:hypothetical protein
MLPYLLIAQLYCTDTVRGRDFVVMCEYFQTVQIDSVYRIDGVGIHHEDRSAVCD